MSAPEKKRGNSKGKPAGVGGLITDVQGEGGAGRPKNNRRQKVEGDCLKNGLFEGLMKVKLSQNFYFDLLPEVLVTSAARARK